MTWYTKTDTQQLDYNKPIMTTNKDESVIYLLLPTNKDNSYWLRGYDWFNIITGEWNSCKNWSTVKEALEHRRSYYNIRNCNIDLK